MAKKMFRRRDRVLSQSDMVLVALYRVAQGTTSKVPYEAWRDFPEVFSLRNHPEHPDASDIHKKLYQSLKSDGSAISLGNKYFRLSEKGVDKAKKILDSGEKFREDDAIERLSREEEDFLRHGLGTRAYSAWRNGKTHDLVDYDARLFFRIGVSTPIDKRVRQVDIAREAIRKAVILGLEGAAALNDLAEHLLATFSETFHKGG